MLTWHKVLISKAISTTTKPVSFPFPACPSLPQIQPIFPDLSSNRQTIFKKYTLANPLFSNMEEMKASQRITRSHPSCIWVYMRLRSSGLIKLSRTFANFLKHDLFEPQYWLDVGNHEGNCVELILINFMTDACGDVILPDHGRMVLMFFSSVFIRVKIVFVHCRFISIFISNQQTSSSRLVSSILNSKNIRRFAG